MWVKQFKILNVYVCSGWRICHSGTFTWYLIAATTTRWNNDVLMLAQRLRRWSSIKTSLLQRVVFAGTCHIITRILFLDPFSQCLTVYRHMGDWGNYVEDSNGAFQDRFVDEYLSLDGEFSVVGRLFSVSYFCFFSLDFFLIIMYRIFRIRWMLWGGWLVVAPLHPYIILQWERVLLLHYNCNHNISVIIICDYLNQSINQ